MRVPLDDITNTVTPTTSNIDGSKQNTTIKSSSSTILLPTISLPPFTSSSSRPKLLRQTSLLAFTAARSVPSSSSHASTSSTTCSSPIASTSSSSPPPPPPPSSSSSALLHPPSDEGYSSSTTARDFDMGLDCDGARIREDEDEEEDDAFSETEHQQHSKTKRQRRSSTSYTHHYAPPIAPVRDPAAIARQAKAMARNKANLFGDTSRATRFEDVARLSEYTRGGISGRNVLGRVLDRHPNHYLEAFISHNTRDVFRCPSYRGHRDYAPPFACAFSKESKRGGKKLLAVASEEGTVCFVDSEKRGGSRVGDATYFQAHNNAVFDLVWSADDRQIATASGDQSAAVADVERQIRTHTLKTHSCSVKQIIFDPHNPNLLATASRDGSIGLWDLRSKTTKDGSLATVNQIRFAHDTYAKSRKGKDNVRSQTRSPTSIVYMQHQDNLLASGGSADGVVKLWDLRKTFSKRINPPFIEESMDYTPVSSFDIQGPPPPSSSYSTFSSTSSSSPANSYLSSTASSSFSSVSSSFAPSRTTRTHGISSLCLSPDGSRLYALSTNAKIYQHDPLFLSRPLPAPMHTFSSPSMCSSSFYIRLAISPDGRYIAAGSSSNGWQTSIWDTQAQSARVIYGETKTAGVALKGHGHEVGGIDWGDGVLATCGDDDRVRLWRSDPHWSKICLSKSDAHRYQPEYSGTWDMID